MINKILLSVCIALLIVAPSPAGGPENAVVVINEESASSKLIANHYIFQRKIPATNVIYLTDIPEGEDILLEECRDKIIRPVFETIEDRGIANHIDYVIYSSGFPTSVNGRALQNELRSKGDSISMSIANNKTFAPRLSLTSATYLFQSVLSQDHKSYLSLNSNFYVRGGTKQILTQPFVGKDQAQFQQALIYARGKKLAESIEVLEPLAKKHPMQVAVLYWLARVNAKKGDADNASKWLRNAVEAGWSYRDYTTSDTVFDGLKNNATFKSTLNAIPNLPFRNLVSQSFRSAYRWGRNGSINSTNDQGRHYMLSTMLGVTRNQGNSEQETLSYLARSIAADGTRPKGTFYFTSTGDVRTKTRKPAFNETIEELGKLGFRSEVIAGRHPVLKNDIVGLTMGTAKFDWKTAKSTILPGAICENLTSFGGRLKPNSGQTKLTEYLRFGAAGSSGTVLEPYAIQAKFPHPRIHVHYARGCTLAESFYQSVAGPFQLLIVGDALCKPWARIPKLSVAGSIKKSKPVSGNIEINLDGQKSPVPISATEIYVNGKLVGRIEKTGAGPFKLDTKTMPDGYHEFRFVPIAAGSVATRGSVIVPIIVDNNHNSVELKITSNSRNIDDAISFEVSAPDATEIKLVHNSRTLASKPGTSASFKVAAYKLGRGPVVVNAVATIDGKPVSSRPVQLSIEGTVLTTLPIEKSAPRGSKKPK